LANPGLELIRANPLASEIRARGLRQRGDWNFEEITSAIVGREQRANLIVDRSIATARLRDKRSPPLGRLRQSPFEDFPHSAPVFGTL
jgi:hypothetical protein